MWCCSEAPRARSARIDAVRCTALATALGPSSHLCHFGLTELEIVKS